MPKATKAKKPPAAPVREFTCQIETGCNQTQYLLSQSRKCISDHFGRNKKCTRAIADPIIWCRSCYQRKSYQPGWPGRKINLIREQLRRIEIQEPGVNYVVVIKHSEQERLNKFNNGNAVDEPVRNPHDKSYRAPITVLQHIYTNWVGPGVQTLAEIITLVDYVASLWNDDPKLRQIDDVPSFELLANFACLNQADNYGMAKAQPLPRAQPLPTVLPVPSALPAPSALPVPRAPAPPALIIQAVRKPSPSLSEASTEVDVDELSLGHRLKYNKRKEAAAKSSEEDEEKAGPPAKKPRLTLHVAEDSKKSKKSRTKSGAS